MPRYGPPRAGEMAPECLPGGVLQPLRNTAGDCLGAKGKRVFTFSQPPPKKYWCDDYQEAGCAESWLLSLPSAPTAMGCLQHRLPCRRRSRPGCSLFLSLPSPLVSLPALSPPLPRSGFWSRKEDPEWVRAHRGWQL